jgi:hypothetical protein
MWQTFTVETDSNDRRRVAAVPCFPTSRNAMKITRKSRSGERREALLKEYFLTASLIAMLKRVGEEAAKVAPRGPQREVATARVKV